MTILNMILAYLRIPGFVGNAGLSMLSEGQRVI